MFHHDRYHTGRVSYLGPLQPDLKWVRGMGGGVENASAAIGKDGTIYIGAASGYIAAFNPDGTLKWGYNAGSPINSALAVTADDTIYATIENGTLQAIKNGIKQWQYDTGARILWSSPTIGTDGTIYFGSDSMYLYALNPDGSLKWRFQTDGWVNNTPAIAPDGTIYIGSQQGGKLYAINPDGTQKWYFQGSGAIQASSPAIGDGGTVYIGFRGGNVGYGLYAINPDGTLKWRTLQGADIDSTPAIAVDGTLYVGTVLGGVIDRLYAISPDEGHIIWDYLVGDYIRSSPTIDGEGNIYLASGTSSDGYINSFTKNGALRWKYRIIHGGNSNPVIAPDGSLYIGGADFYAFRSQDTNSPVITINSPKGTVSTQTVQIDVSITDPSGVASYSYFVDGNNISNTSTSLNLTYFQPGNHTFKVEATDTKGNVGSETSIFTYSPTPKSLKDTLDQMYQDGKITKLGSSLYDKLDQAQNYINSGQYTLARETLLALIHEIEAQSGKKITADAGNILIAQIMYLIDSLP